MGIGTITDSRPTEFVFLFELQALGDSEEELSVRYSDTVSWLKTTMTEESRQNSPNTDYSSFCDLPFHKLPEKVRKLIYRHTVLPLGLVIHPCLPIYIDDNRNNILHMLLTNRLIPQLTAEVIYVEALFSCCNTRSQHQFKEFLHKQSPRQRVMMRRFFCPELDRWLDRGFFNKFLRTQFPNMTDWAQVGGFRWWLNKHPCFYLAPA
jgi:hypothetical protein